MVPDLLALLQHAIFLKQAMTTARIGPWKLYPGLATIEVSPEMIRRTHCRRDRIGSGRVSLFLSVTGFVSVD